MGIAEVEEAYIDNLRQLEDPGAQCDYLMTLGMGFRGDEDIRTGQYRIGGCKTAIWLKAGRNQGMVGFTGDSDSLLVKGVLFILGQMYDSRSIQEVKGHPPVFADYISDKVIYPEIKQNGILKCYQRLAALCLN